MSEIDHRIYHPIDKSYSTPASLISPLCIHHVNGEWDSSECPYSMEGGVIPCLQEYPYVEMVYNATGTVDESGQTIVSPCMLWNRPKSNASYPVNDPLLMTIDGEKAIAYTSSYTFNTIGRHTVRFYSKSKIDRFRDNATHVFYQCYNLIEVHFPSTFTDTKERTFEYCTSLTAITGTEHLKYIRYFAFSYLPIKQFVAPYTLIQLGRESFCGTGLPNGFICPLFTPPTMAHAEAFKIKFPKIYVPAESLETYKTATNWSAHASRIVPMTKSMRLKYPPR